MQPRIAISLLLVLTACTIDRGTSPNAQPQKTALIQCYAQVCPRPLFVVDGKRLADQSVDLNPNDIESVEVFKGPKAIEIYGEEARNGVVVITSRKTRLTNK
jgi:TonB-dependent SusC/RagA subfamily outer membrane receptor